MKRHTKYLTALLAAVCTVVTPPAQATNMGKVGQTNPISAGDEGCAVLRSDGSLLVWGANDFGQVGNGTTTEVRTPTKIMDEVASVAIGFAHCAALKKDGSLWMWGSNIAGEIGNGGQSNAARTESEPLQTVPVKIMDEVAAVALGSTSSAAIKKDGSLWMWGAGLPGQNELTQSSVPIKIMDEVAAVSLSGTSGISVAALKKDGSLWMWGEGLPGTEDLATATTPTKIMDEVTAVSLGRSHYAALKKDGSLWMWGSNRYGQVGNSKAGNKMDTTTDRPIPYQTFPVKIMDEVASVSLGSDHSAAIKKDGSLWTWGYNNSGEIGNNGASNQQDMPDEFGTSNQYQTIPVKIMDDVADVSLGWWYSTALKTDGSFWMFGYSSYVVVDNSPMSGQTDPPGSLVPVKILDGIALPATASAAPTGYTVTLSLGEGGQSTVTVEKDALLTPPSSPTRAGYFFAGWFQDSAYTKPWNFDTDKVRGDCTLYAKWVAKTTSTTVAEPSTQVVLLDGKTVTIPTYMLRDNQRNAVNFVRLRDIAYLLNHTPGQFNVDFRGGAIRVDIKTPYTTQNGTEMTTPAFANTQIQSNPSPVLSGGIVAPLEAFRLIDQKGGGHTYFKLRDLGELAQFSVDWDNVRRQIVIRTDGSEQPSETESSGAVEQPAQDDKALSEDFISAVIELVNEERTKAGLSPLKTDPKVQQAAQVRAPELAVSFEHTRPDGSSCFTALDEADVRYYSAGENIASGQTTPDAVMRSWMNSEGHRSNILNAGFTTIGVGYTVVNGRPYWVQLFTS